MLGATQGLRDRLAVRASLAWHDVVAVRGEKAINAVARALPDRLRYAVFITVAADSTCDPELSGSEVPGVALDDLLRVTHRQLTKDRRRFPFVDGDVLVLGPQTFIGWPDGKPVINYRGENYEPQPDAEPLRKDFRAAGRALGT